MKILDLRTMRGPSYWSVKHPKVIVLKLDLGDLADTWSNAVPGLDGRLVKHLPELVQPCSKNARQAAKRPPLSREQLSDGEPWGHVVQHVALVLQRMAGMPVSWGKSRPAHEDGMEMVLFEYQEERAGRVAAEAAVDLLNALIRKEKFDVRAIVDELHNIREDEYFGPSTFSIVSEAASRGIPYIQLEGSNIIQLGYGVNQKRIWATTTSLTSHAAVEIAGNKNRTKRMLHAAGVPVPRGTTVYDADELRQAVEDLGYPIVTKPLDGNHGKGASINLKNWKEALAGMKAAQAYSEAVIVEQFIEGFDFRLLVIGGKLVAAAKRTPAAVTGDGLHSIQELVDEINKDPRRGIGHEKVLTQIKIDKHTQQILKARELTPKSVLPAGEVLYLKSTANISTGGTATDVTDLVDPYNVLLAERVAGIVGLDVCGIDVLTTDIAIPLNETRGAVIEVNAAPGFRMHTNPADGLPRNVAAPVVDMLFPAGAKSRIPIFAVTGTNGKTTTTLLLAHIVSAKGYKVGHTTTSGIFIQGRQLQSGDCTGSQSTEFVLKDPTVNFAVLEVARGGMLRSGLGFRYCDVAVVTNVAADHLGQKDIHTVDDMAQVKGVLPRTVRKGGWAVLNADNDYTYAMREQVRSRVALFSMHDDNIRIREHVENGGVAAVYEEGYLTIYKNTYKLRIAKAEDLPVTFGGRARFNIENALAAALAAYCYGFTKDDIKTALCTFTPSAEKTPGRMNIFHFPTFEAIVDYAHNTHGIEKFGEFLDATPATHKVGIVSGLGDRREEDTIEYARVASRLFDEVILRQDNDLRGKTAEEIEQLMRRGLTMDKPDLPITYIENEMEAIDYALQNAREGSVVTIFTEDIKNALARVEEHEARVGSGIETNNKRVVTEPVGQQA